MSPPLNVVMVEPEVPWNAGNAGRSCLAAGARLHLVEPLGFDLGERGVRRAGLDYWPRVNPVVWPSPSAMLEGLASTRIVAVTPEADAALWDCDLTGPVSLLFGRESTGLPTALRALPAAHLPMTEDHVRSLNVSTTIGIALWEALRQRHR